MKVLLVHPYMNVRGGAERQVINLGIELKKLGVDVKLLTFLIEKNKGYNEFFDKLEIIVFPKLIPFKYLLEFYPLVVSVMDYSKIFDKFDVINVHNFPANWIIQNCNKPVIWSANEVPWLTYSPTFMRFLRKRFLYKIFAKIDKNIVKNHIDKIVVLDKQRQKDIKLFYGRRSDIVRSGIDVEIFKPIEKSIAKTRLENLTQRKLKGVIILFVAGRLEPQKRLIDFLNCAKILKERGIEITSIIVGEGSENKLIEKFKNKINIVHLTNEWGKFLSLIYNASDILIFPAVNQPWGLVPFEALACNTIPIVSKVCGAAEVLRHKKTGIIVEPMKPQLLAEWVEYCINNKNEIEVIKKRGRKFVIDELTVNKYAKNMLKKFKEVMKYGE